MKLSILIPTLKERKILFMTLLRVIKKQAELCYKVHPTLGEVEIIWDNSKKFTEGGLSIGEKRQSLVNKANGDYLCFLDDDDTVSPDYIETLLRLCYQKNDVCTFSSFSKLDNYWLLVNMSLFNKTNDQSKPGIIKRLPWHICPVKSVYAKKVKFQNSNYGEDWQWFSEVLRMCTSESHTDAILHQYNHSLSVSQSDNKTTSIG